LIAYSGTFGYLAQISAVSRFAQYIPTCLAVIVFAKTKTKDKSSTFHLPLGPVIPAVAILVSIWLLVQVQVSQLVIGLGALLVAVTVLFLDIHVPAAWESMKFGK
ncbi:hypothetical protein PZ01_03970, partial [Lacticaseibacillus rhamnosus]